MKHFEYEDKKFGFCQLTETFLSQKKKYQQIIKPNRNIGIILHGNRCYWKDN